MKKNYFGPGPYLEFEETGTVLSHGSDAVDCALVQASEQVVVDVCMDGAGRLQFGVDGAQAYVANIIIPGKQFTDQVVRDTDGVPILDDNGAEQTEQVAVPMDMVQVTGNLWTLPEQTTNNDEHDTEEI